jgi:hypothetical protein
MRGTRSLFWICNVGAPLVLDALLQNECSAVYPEHFLPPHPAGGHRKRWRRQKRIQRKCQRSTWLLQVKRRTSSANPNVTRHRFDYSDCIQNWAVPKACPPSPPPQPRLLSLSPVRTAGARLGSSIQMQQQQQQQQQRYHAEVVTACAAQWSRKSSTSGAAPLLIYPGVQVASLEGFSSF